MQKVPRLMPDTIPLSRLLARKFGVCGALLLQQMHFRISTGNKFIDGRSWVYNTYSEWGDELGNLYSISSIRRALRLLEKYGALVIANYNKKGYDQTVWYSIDYGKLEPLQLAALANFKMETPIKIEGGAVQNEQTYTLDVPLEEDEFIGEIPSVPHKEEQVSNQSPGKRIKLINMAKGPSSATLILEQLKIQQGKVSALPPNSVKSLRRIWSEVPRYNDSVQFMPELTIRQVGALSYIAKHLGPMADSALRCIVSHWIGYVKFVAQQRGLHKTPNVPTLEFVQKYASEAVNFSKSLAIPEPVQSTAKADVMAKKATPQAQQSKPISGKLPKLVVKTKVKSPAKETVDTTSPDPDDAEKPVDENGQEEAATLEDVLKWKPQQKGQE